MATDSRQCSATAADILTIRLISSLRRTSSHCPSPASPSHFIKIMLNLLSDWRLCAKMFYFLSKSEAGQRSIVHILKMRALDFICALKSLKQKHTTTGDGYERSGYDRKQRNTFKSLLLSIILLPLSATHFFWIYLPRLIYSTLCAYFLILFHIASKKNKHAKHIVIHITALLKIGEYHYKIE